MKKKIIINNEGELRIAIHGILSKETGEINEIYYDYGEKTWYDTILKKLTDNGYCLSTSFNLTYLLPIINQEMNEAKEAEKFKMNNEEFDWCTNNLLNRCFYYHNDGKFWLTKITRVDRDGQECRPDLYGYNIFFRHKTKREIFKPTSSACYLDFETEEKRLRNEEIYQKSDGKFKIYPRTKEMSVNDFDELLGKLIIERNQIYKLVKGVSRINK